ncbi:MAG: tetratricopeptide repeat protein [Candidatus Sericytochromatia bacterium]
MDFKKAFLTSFSSFLLPFSALAGNLEDGISLYKSGEYEKAIEKFNKAVKEDSENPEPHLWLSKSYEALLQVENVFPEKKLYDALRAKKLLKQQQEAEKKEQEEAKKKEEEENKIIEVVNEFKIIPLNISYLPNIFSKRNPEDQVKNLKFLDFKTLKELFNSALSDSESLKKLLKEIEIKKHYGFATPTEIISMYKAKADLISYDIDVKKLDYEQETELENKKLKKLELEKLVKEYNNNLDLAEKTINQVIYVDAEPTSYDYFVASETPADIFIQTLEDKRTVLKPILTSMSTDISNLKKAIQSQEKDLIDKSKGIDSSLLDADIRTLEGSQKEKVSLYQSVRDKLNGDRTKLNNIILENDIIVSFYNKIPETIKKINPNYVSKTK